MAEKVSGKVSVKVYVLFQVKYLKFGLGHAALKTNVFALYSMDMASKYLSPSVKLLHMRNAGNYQNPMGFKKSSLTRLYSSSTHP